MKELMKMHREAVDKCNEARKQLAAEQEKRELAETLFRQRDKEMTENLALAVRLEQERNQLQKQLAAERLKALNNETHARNTLADLIETLEAENSELKAQLNAERKLRAEIAADLGKISEQFNKLIA